MRYAVLQTGKHKFVIAEQAYRGGTYRKIAETDNEHNAKLVKDALAKVYEPGEDK